MSERLEEIKEQVKYLQGDFLRDDLGWLIEQAEQEQNHSRKIDQLHMFLQKNVETKAEHFGKHVIDVAMEIIKELTEQVQELESDKLTKESLHAISKTKKIEQQNNRYRNLLESLSNTHDIASKIMKEQPDKKIIDANDILQYILRKINDELERVS